MRKWLGVFLIALVPALAHAASAGSDHVRFGPLLFGLAVLVVAAKAGGLAAASLGQPPVLGELLVGIGLGNVLLPVFGSTLQLARSDPTLAFLGQVGVLILLFDVGLEADLRALAKVGASSLLVALIGIAVPMGLGWALAAWWLPQSSAVPVSDTGIAGTRSASGGVGGAAWAAQPASKARVDSMAARAAGWYGAWLTVAWSIGSASRTSRREPLLWYRR